MSLDRRQLLRGSLAAGAAAAVPAGALAGPAYGAGAAAQAPPLDFHLALVDYHNEIIENHYAGDIDEQDRFPLQPKTSFKPGWAPLECEFRTLHGESVFMVCGGTSTDGNVTIHRSSDSAALGWTTGLGNYPHSLEYLPGADAVVVVGTRGMDGDDPPPPGERPGGSYYLFQAPSTSSPGPLKKISGPHAFRQAHGVVLDQTDPTLLWIYGGNKLLAYGIEGTGMQTRLRYLEPRSLTDNKFENGHDLSPDPVDTQYLWATGTELRFRIDKSGRGRPRIDWEYPPRKVKSFSKHSSGRGVYTADTLGNKFGSPQVQLVAPNQLVTAREHDGQKEKWIYKARFTTI